jgi:hypothetical protein
VRAENERLAGADVDFAKMDRGAEMPEKFRAEIVTPGPSRRKSGRGHVVGFRRFGNDLEQRGQIIAACRNA